MRMMFIRQQADASALTLVCRVAVSSIDHLKVVRHVRGGARLDRHPGDARIKRRNNRTSGRVDVVISFDASTEVRPSAGQKTGEIRRVSVDVEKLHSEPCIQVAEHELKLRPLLVRSVHRPEMIPGSATLAGHRHPSSSVARHWHPARYVAYKGRHGPHVSARGLCTCHVGLTEVRQQTRASTITLVSLSDLPGLPYKRHFLCGWCQRARVRNPIVGTGTMILSKSKQENMMVK